MIHFMFPPSLRSEKLDDGLRAANLRAARTRIRMKEAASAMDLTAYREAKRAHLKAFDLLQAWKAAVEVAL